MSETNGFVGNAKHPPVGTADDVFSYPYYINLNLYNWNQPTLRKVHAAINRRPPVMPIIVCLYLPLN